MIEEDILKQIQDGPGAMIFVDKAAGMSSFGAVARVRKQLSDTLGRRVKVGHTGTLDPFATGLLILVAGKMTKKAGEFSGLDKEYEATFVLGAESSTGDPEGEIRESGDTLDFSEEDIRHAMKKFVGEIEQKPPIYSAIKIDGQRAYKLARKGETPEMPTRKVKIYEFELLDWQAPELRVRVKVSSGTYIRSLAEDLARELGTVAYTKELRRTQVGKYVLSELDKNSRCLHL